MKKQLFGEWISNPRNFFAYFVFGILLFTVVGDGVSFLFWEVVGGEELRSWLTDWLEVKFGIKQTWFMEKNWFHLWITLILSLLLLLLGYATHFARWFSRLLSSSQIIVTPRDLTETFPGLIVAMSPKSDSPAEVAIRHHWNQGNHPHLKHCWIICTEKSLPFAKEMIKKFTDEQITQLVQFYYGEHIMEHPEQTGQSLSLLVPNDLFDDPDYIRNLIDSIYADAEQKGLDESDIIADYTGSTKGATAGMILACADPQRKLEYISQVEWPKLKAIDISYKIRRTD